MNVDDAIINFQNFNLLNINNYSNTDNGSYEYDLFIAREDFKDRVDEWLSMALSQEMKDEFLLLLSHYNYLPEKRFNREIRRIINRVVEESKLDLDRILFLVLPSKKGCESGADFIMTAISIASRGKATIENRRMLPALNDLYPEICSDDLSDEEKNEKQKEYKVLLKKYIADLKIKMDMFDAIVFIDDIYGSGSTLYRYFTSFIDVYKTVKSKQIYVASICANEDKLKRKLEDIKKLGINITDMINIINHKKCYDDNPPISLNKDMIKHFEQKIEDNKEDTETKSCVMGFANGQFLVSFFYNTPNNTLSLFWRKTPVSRYPLFIRNRQQYDRPSIEQMKLKKKQTAITAYNMGKGKRLSNAECNKEDYSGNDKSE